jgi:hypothetical protein
MKKLLPISFLLLLTAPIGLFAQNSDAAIKEVAAKSKDVKLLSDTISKKWRFGGSLAANFGQVALVNWAGGGQNSISALINGNAFTRFKKGKWSWDNDLVVSWGIIAQGKLRDIQNNKFPVRKNVDLLQLTSVAGYSLDKNNKVFIAGLMDFRSQLSNGNDYPGDSAKDRVSAFAAPAYLTLSLGINYKPVSYFTLYVSPLAGKLTFVTKDVPGATTLNDIDERRYGLDLGEVMRAEIGADFQKDIFKNVNLKTSIELFQNYTEKKKLDILVDEEIKLAAAEGVAATQDQLDKLYYDNRKNTDLNWTTAITFKINKFLQASLETQLIYDHDIVIPKQRGDGTPYKGRGTQFRQGFNLGIGYKF